MAKVRRDDTRQPFNKLIKSRLGQKYLGTEFSKLGLYGLGKVTLDRQGG